MAASGFDKNGFIHAVNTKEAMDYYKTLFGMEEVYHHMDTKLQINGKLFFEIREVTQEQFDTYINAVMNAPILATAAFYETKEDVMNVHKQLSAEALGLDKPVTLPWCPLSFSATDKYGVSWYISTWEHLPCSDCKKSDCEGDWNSRCRLPKWTVELYEKHGTDWWQFV